MLSFLGLLANVDIVNKKQLSFLSRHLLSTFLLTDQDFLLKLALRLAGAN